MGRCQGSGRQDWREVKMDRDDGTRSLGRQLLVSAHRKQTSSGLELCFCTCNANCLHLPESHTLLYSVSNIEHPASASRSRCEALPYEYA